MVEDVLSPHVSTYPIDHVYKHLEKYHGIAMYVASNRLHRLKEENDLKEMLRLRARLADPSEVRLAILERNGQISAIPARKLQVVDVAVESHVQTVRLEFAGGS